MPYVITGATGNLGGHVIHHLIANGVAPGEITAVGRNQSRLDELAGLGVGVAVADYQDRDALTAAFSGADTLLLISASEPGTRVEAHTNAIEAARAAGIGRIVYTSLAHADTSTHSLAPDHKATEELLRASGLRWTFLRNNWYSENHIADLDGARQSGKLITSAGDGRIASASRSDYAEAAAIVLVSDRFDNTVLELSGDVAWSYDELAAAIADVIGSPVEVVQVDNATHIKALEGFGLPAEVAAFVASFDIATKAGQLADATDVLSGLLGRPTTPLVDGLRAATA